MLVFQKASKEPILEEAELDFKPLEECEEGLEEENGQHKETKETETESNRELERKGEQARRKIVTLNVFHRVKISAHTSPGMCQLSGT